MHRTAVIAFLALCMATPASAEGFEPVTGRQEFLALVEGRELRHGLLGIRISILPDGRIEGEAVRWPVTGSWHWQDGYFCREMDWSGREIPFNCQLVERRDARELRFTVDQGAGESATFRLR